MILYEMIVIFIALAISAAVMGGVSDTPIRLSIGMTLH